MHTTQTYTRLITAIGPNHAYIWAITQQMPSQASVARLLNISKNTVGLAVANAKMQPQHIFQGEQIEIPMELILEHGIKQAYFIVTHLKNSNGRKTSIITKDKLAEKLGVSESTAHRWAKKAKGFVNTINVWRDGRQKANRYVVRWNSMMSLVEQQIKYVTKKGNTLIKKAITGIKHIDRWLRSSAEHMWFLMYVESLSETKRQMEIYNKRLDANWNAWKEQVALEKELAINAWMLEEEEEFAKMGFS